MFRSLTGSAILLFATSALSFNLFTLRDYSGGELFQTFCASCHGETGRGDGPVAPGLAVAVPDLTTISRRYGEFPAARIRETVDGRGGIEAHGVRSMPVWGYEFWLEEGADAEAERQMHETIDRLVEYLRTLQADSARQSNGSRKL